MTIYLVEWTDSEADFPAQRRAYRTLDMATKKMNRLIKEDGKGITPPGQVQKYLIKTKDDLVNLINELQ